MTNITEQGAQNFSLPAINQNMNIPNLIFLILDPIGIS